MSGVGAAGGAGAAGATDAAGAARGASGARLTARDLRLHLGGRQLLDGIDLTIEPGEVVAVMGPSGAGKSSLLMILAGVLRPDSGSVALTNASGHRHGRGERGAANMGGETVLGFVPQTLGLSPTSTASENVALTMQVRNVPTAEIRSRARDALVAVGLGSQRDRIVTELSGGQRQRVAVARALAMRPDVLIADEATAELDVENQRIVMDLFERAAEEGAAVVVATHDPLVAERCNRTYRLEDGRLLEGAGPDPEATETAPVP